MIISGAEPFLFHGSNKVGVLLVHGYSGSPAEVRELGEKLYKEERYTVLGVLLPGHGTDPHNLEHTTWEDWYLAVQAGVRQLQRDCDKVVVIGMSMGSLLTLKAAAEFNLDAIVVMSTPIYLYDWRVHFLWLAKRLSWAMPKRGKRVTDADQRFNVAYDCLPLEGVKQTWNLITYCKRYVLKKVKAPCLIIQSKLDHTVRPLSARYIYKSIASKIKRIYYLENSRHVLTLYQEREPVMLEIIKFIKEQL